ncbi:MAG: formate--tetrahydrofolate ligase, partial [Alphaproteobacteria bacterium]|nr:formate--tetrahydrofolate ligase [Alphaproteobacteria bacterium]
MNQKHSEPLTDIEIARAARPAPIETVAAELGIPADAVYRHGPHKAKLAMDFVTTARSQARGKLILVTAISPTPAGEGKTTTTVGLGDALRRIGKRTAICLREPSLGPCFGAKGGAAGGGWAQVVPMDEINLHFTGDFHAIGAANNLLAAMIDNHVYWGNLLDIDPRRITWKRAMDLNDRALRQIVVGLGNNGAAREDGFDITVASEIMAIFCLATSLDDLKERLGRIAIGETKSRRRVLASELNAHGAMTALLKDALQPNLVQTIEHTPAFVHGGPFANIAHGCNSVLATSTALTLADYVVTEAGFGADLGAEKFFDIKCRKAGLAPAAAVVVATVRALKMHGGVARDALGAENVGAVERGCVNLARHIENLRKFGVPPVVAINRFTCDTAAEFAAIQRACSALDVRAHACAHWADGGKGAADLARDVAALADSGKAKFQPLYPDDLPLADKMRRIATEIYRASDIALEPSAASRLKQIEDEGYRALPVCMAKTQYSFTTNPDLKGAPSGHVIPIREVRLSAGAGFVVALCGDIMTMPGLPRAPAAAKIGLDA